MTNQDPLIDNIVAKISTLLGGKLPQAGQLKSELQGKLRVLLQASFADLDIVSRDEFEAQAAVLQRSREKIDAMELQLAELERQLNG